MANTQTRYAQHNLLCVTGRIFNIDIVDGKDGQFMAVSVISTATKNGTDVVYTFTNSNGLMSLYNEGIFTVGREITISGKLADVKQVYTAKDGSVRLLKRPEIKMLGVQVLEGGIGRAPQEKVSNNIVAGTVVTVGTPATDATPSYKELKTAEDLASL